MRINRCKLWFLQLQPLRYYCTWLMILTYHYQASGKSASALFEPARGHAQRQNLAVVLMWSFLECFLLNVMFWRKLQAVWNFQQLFFPSDSGCGNQYPTKLGICKCTHNHKTGSQLNLEFHNQLNNLNNLNQCDTEPMFPTHHAAHSRKIFFRMIGLFTRDGNLVQILITLKNSGSSIIIITVLLILLKKQNFSI